MTRIGGAAAYRWVTLLMAAAVWAHCFGDARLAEFGWQFRHLEVWALSGSLVSAAFMVRLSMGWSAAPHRSFAAAVAALNALVIALYLAGALGGPAGPGGWKAGYLLALGPALQIADALVILGAFGRVSGAMAWLAGGAAAYVAWLELAVRPLNLSPDGSGGLPYAALNALETEARLWAYAAAALAAFGALAALRGLQRALRGSIEPSGPLAAG